MSAITLIADIDGWLAHVRFVPTADIALWFALMNEAALQMG